MNKKLQAVLIIASILILALKDSASLVHTVLHFIPNNPWHHHEEITRHKHHINPLEIHTYLANKHAHTHHRHTHDLMDHMHHDEQADENTDASNEIKPTIKIDYYFQSLSGFLIHEYAFNTNLNHFSTYIAFIRHRGINPPYQPPQV